MKKIGKKFWAAGLAAGLLLTALPSMAYGSQEGPGMANGQELPTGGMNSGGVIRRDSGASDETAELKMDNQVIGVDEASVETETASEALPGVSVDSLSGLTYDIRQIKAAQAEDVEQRAQILMSYLSENQKGSCRDGAHTLEEYMRQRIYATKGNITIGMLSRETGYSECYIRRIFKQIHGISPKEFERFIRFQTFLNEITAAPGEADSEETALNCGYYDQSHMLKDFRAFAGTTPEKYKKRICDGSDRRAAHTTINKQKENTHGIIKN